MTGSPDDAKALSPDPLTADAVAAWLKSHPNFLTERPDLLATLIPPEFDHGRGVIDLQRFMIDRLRGDHARISARERALLTAAESNAGTQARVHAAVKALLAPRSFEALIRVVSEDLPGLFGIKAVALCVETGEPLPGNAADVGIIVIPPGTLDDLFKSKTSVVLRADVQGDKAIFGRNAGRIRSVALMRLDFGKGAPRGMLALGSTALHEFDPRQGTELLAFFGFVLQHRIRRWLGVQD